jgi:hypothetical protein
MTWNCLKERARLIARALLFLQEEEKTPSMRDMFTTHRSVTMKHFLESRILDDSTKQLVQDYNRTGTGVFTKGEVVNIIRDLRAEMKQEETLKIANIFYRRCLISAVILSLFLLASMFGLSYAVAALTAKTDVRNGTLMAKGSSTTIATDFRADTFVMKDKLSNATYCLSEAEAIAIQELVFGGRNVIVEFKDDGTDSEGTASPFLQLSPSGSVYGDEPGHACYFSLRTGKQYCVTDMVECSPQQRLGDESCLDCLGFGISYP